MLTSDSGLPQSAAVHKIQNDMKKLVMLMAAALAAVSLVMAQQALFDPTAKKTTAVKAEKVEVAKKVEKLDCKTVKCDTVAVCPLRQDCPQQNCANCPQQNCGNCPRQNCAQANCPKQNCDSTACVGKNCANCPSAETCAKNNCPRYNCAKTNCAGPVCKDAKANCDKSNACPQKRHHGGKTRAKK